MRKPEWIRVKAPTSRGYAETREIVKSHKLVTVCEEAGCPNIGECWDKKHATFMIMGEICTRACAFCNVATGKPNPLDPDEPEVLPVPFPVGVELAPSTAPIGATLPPHAAAMAAPAIAGRRAPRRT